MNTPQLRIFQLFDCEWWIGPSLAAVKEQAAKDYGFTQAEVEDQFGDAYELTDESLDKTRFAEDSDEHAGMTFREVLALEIAHDPVTPQNFAGTEA